MSATSVQIILLRAMRDPAFAEQLLHDTDQAVAGYDVTAEELENFRAMSRGDFAKWTQDSPEERKSFGVIVPERNHNETSIKSYQ